MSSPTQQKSSIQKFDGEFAFLSNKAPSTFFYKGIKYKTVVHAYQSLKAKYELDAIKIRSAKTPEEAIKIAKSVQTKENWQTACREVMYELIYQKFKTNDFLKPKLLATKGKTLSEGKTFVGELLMDVRKQIEEEEENEPG